MYQRSADLILGVPHNWVQYWAFGLWLQHRTGIEFGEFVWQGGDVHVYSQHADLARRVEDAFARTPDRPAPALVYDPTGPEFKAADFALDGEYKYDIDEPVEMVV